MIAVRFSTAPLGLPGRVMITVDFLVPATGRDIAANGVIDNEDDSMACTKPDACLSSICDTASGVLSFSVNPVPPLVTIRLISALASVHARIEAWICPGSSGTIFVAATCHCVEAGGVDSFSWVKDLRSKSVVRSVVVPPKALVDTMRMPTRRIVVEVESRVSEAIISCCL